MRMFLALLAVTLSAATMLVATASASPTKACHNISDTVGNITVRNLTCKRAKKVIRSHLKGRMTPFGFTCTQKRFEGGVTNRCEKGRKRLVYSLAD